MTQHSPTPWRAYVTPGGAQCIAPSKGYTVCSMVSGQPREDAANAAYIVQCVNAHQELVTALEALVRLADDGAYVDITATDRTPIMQRIRAALAKATGKESHA